MPQYLANELAKLFKIEKSTIRYYVDQKLLTPKQNHENGYYLFDEENVYQLYQIMVLKQAGYSLREIKAMIERTVKISDFEQASINLQLKIEALQFAKKRVDQIVSSYHKYRVDEVLFHENAKLYLKKFPKSAFKDGELDVINAIQNGFSEELDSIYYVFDDSQNLVPCFETEDSRADFYFSEGTYLSKSFKVTSEADIERELASILEDPICLLSTEKEPQIIIFENTSASLAYDDVLIYTLEMRISE